jgi:translocation and assembly module TamA
MRDSLAELEVFSRVRVGTADALDAEGRLPVFVEVNERPPRVVGFNADFNTSEGLGANAYWGHRNLFGRAESLRLQAEVGRIGRNAPGDIDYGIGARYRAPDFLVRNQVLRAEIAAGREAPDAYRREAVEALVGLDRALSEQLEVSGGVQVEISDVEDIGDSGRLSFLSVPLGLRLDTTDDLLDPKRGVRLALEITPFLGDRDFVRASLAGATYFGFFDDQELVLALRARLGSIFGVELLDLPGDKRFYAGGGGSVRGYAFQAIGPRTPQGDPIGGLSLLELGAEARIRLTDELGFVPFVEGGQVFEDEISRSSDRLQFGAGLGLRYFTGIGPLRLDVAFPLNKRHGDDDFQLYVSIGQAF